MIKVSDYIIQYLEQLDIAHMFMIPGGGAMHLNDSLGKSKKIQYVCCLHEQACAIAAEAYARVNNKLGLVMVTTGPGGTNALTGVAGAYIESTPMLILSGQVKLQDQIRGQHIRQMGMQELDIVSIVQPITKYAAMVTDPMTIRYHLEKALYEAMHGRKGPVWLDIPLDIQASMIDERKLTGYERPKSSESKDLELKAAKVIEAFNHSKRPLFMAGNGIRMADGIDEFRELIEYLGIPIVTTWNGIDLIEEEYPLYFGRPGGLGQRYANFVLQNSDFFLSVGTRLNLLQTGYNFDGFARCATKIMVDIDENELNKINVRPNIKICADAKDFLTELLKQKDAIKRRDYTEWIAYAKNLKEKYPIVTKDTWKKQQYVNTYALLDTLSTQLTPEDIFVIGSSGSCIDVSMQTFRVKEGQRVFTTKGLASMGYGLPSTIGASLASGGKRTVSVQGDGGFQMNIQELETLRRLQLPVKIFVLSNRGYAQIKGTQKNVFEEHYVACNEESNLSIPDISDIAEAYKLMHIKIVKNEELKERVAWVLEQEGPVICEVMVSIDQLVFPKQVSYKRKDGQMESLPLEYMNPPLPEEEFKKNMLIPLYKMS